MTQEKIEQVKDFFLDALPEKLIATLKEYDSFTAHEAPTDTKSFGAYHLACKGALSHIILLFKLLQLVDGASDTEEDGATNWLKRAEKAIAEENDNEDET